MGIRDWLKTIRIKRIAGNTMVQATEAESLEKATKIIIQALLKEPPEMRVQILAEIGEQIDGDANTSNVLLDKVAVGITESKTIPNDILKEGGIQDNMTDKGIVSLIKDGGIDLDMQKTFAGSIDNKESKEEMKSLIADRIDEREEEKRKKKQKEIIDLLSKLYKKCGEVTDSDVITMLSDIPENQKSELVRNEINGIISRQMAFNYLKFGSIIFSRFNDVLSAEEMFDLNYIERIKNEIVKIKANTKEEKDEVLKKLDGFTETWREVLLEDVSKEIANRYIDTGVWDIHYSEEMKNITQNEEKTILESIENKVKKKKKKNLSTEDRLKIGSQIRGKHKVNDIVDYMDKTNTFNMLNSLDEKGAKRAIEAFNEVLAREVERLDKEETGTKKETLENNNNNPNPDQVGTDGLEH